MPDLITFGTILYGVSSFVAEAAVGGLIEGQTDKSIRENWEQFRKNLNRYRPHENHEIQRAAYYAYLQATLQICAQRGEDLSMPVNSWLLPKPIYDISTKTNELIKGKAALGFESDYERQWIDKVKDSVCDRLKNLELPIYYENKELIDLQNEIELLIQIKETEHRELQIRDALVNKVLQELESNYESIPDKIEFLFRKNWFDYLCACFQNQLAKNNEVANKFQNRLLAKILAKNQAGSISEVTAFDIQFQLQRIGGKMSQRLDDVEMLLQNQEKKLEIVEKNIWIPLLATESDTNTRLKKVEEVAELSLETLTRADINISEIKATLIIIIDLVKEILFNSKQSSNNSFPTYSLLHELPIDERVENREKECELLLSAMREEIDARILCFTAPGGFGKTTLLSTLVLKISDKAQTKIIEPGIFAFLHLDCRRGFRLFSFFSKLGSIVGRKEQFEQLSKQPDEELSLINKLDQVFSILSYEAKRKKIWIVLDNFETMLDDESNIIDEGIDSLFSVCFAGHHNIRLLLASRDEPNVSPRDREKQKRLKEIGDNLFEGLPLKKCINYLRKNGAATGLKGSIHAQNEFLIAFSERVHKMPMALTWVLEHLARLNEDKNEGLSYTIADLLKRNELFEEFDKEQFIDAKAYKNKGLKRLHYEQLIHQSQNVLLVLRLLSVWNCPVPRTVFEHLMTETTLASTLTRLTKNKLLSLSRSQNQHIQSIGDPSMINYFALHPVICENIFFSESLQKDQMGYFVQPELAGEILFLYENTADVCGLRARTIFYDRKIYSHAFSLFECAELLYFYLTDLLQNQDLEYKLTEAQLNKNVALTSLGILNGTNKRFETSIERFSKLTNQSNNKVVSKVLSYDLAIAYTNNAVVLRGLGQLDDAIKNYDLAIEILQEAVGSKWSWHLAVAYQNKGVSLQHLNELKEAIKNYDLAIEILRKLKSENAILFDSINPNEDLAMALTNKGEALRLSGLLSDAIESFNLAIEIIESEITVKDKMGKGLGGVYLNKGLTLFSQNNLKESVKNINKSVTVFEQLVKTEGRTELSYELATCYMNLANTLYCLKDFNKSSEYHDKTIEIFERLVNKEKRTELSSNLARAYINQSNIFKQNKDWEKVFNSYVSAIAILQESIFKKNQAHLIPMLMEILNCHLQNLVENEKWNIAANGLIFVYSIIFLLQTNNIPTEVKISPSTHQAISLEFTDLMLKICLLPDEKLEIIYEFCGIMKEKIKFEVESFRGKFF